ncbi:phosphatase PAP2 family protein [Paracoccus sp. (in: a-proteobacteria)]|uniref:phosphatase PAP2 family protein n=1 Tax=Paracoccus sp. TaxID=267 RepID=UPI0035AE0793
MREVSQVLVSQALNIAREGIIDAGAPKTATPRPQPLSPAKRLRRLEYDFAQMILLSDMLDSLTVVPPPKDKALPEIIVKARNGTTETDLFRLNTPSTADFSKELQLVMGYATLRPERLPEITVQTGDLISFYATILPIQPARARMIHYLLDLAMNLSTAIVQRIKLGFDVPRPDTLSDQVQPMLPTPLHASYPSGHATQAFAVAMLLTLLSKPRERPGNVEPDSQLFRMATRIAVNRSVAGVHFPSDSAAGALLGITLARWIAVRAGAMPEGCPSMIFDAPLWGDEAPDKSRDFYLARLCEVMPGTSGCLKYARKPVKVPASDLLEGVWKMASDEWSDRWS